MNKFIVVHENGEEIMINLSWVEEIRADKNDNATIYFAFQGRECIEQDYINVDETYSKVKELIWG